jgi:hypothetical protein
MMFFEKIYHRVTLPQIEDGDIILSAFFSFANGFGVGFTPIPELFERFVAFGLSQGGSPFELDFMDRLTFSLSRSISRTRTCTCCPRETTSIGCVT